jgi:hypothetical protein
LVQLGDLADEGGVPLVRVPIVRVFLTGEFKQGENTIPATLKLVVQAGLITGETALRGADGATLLTLELKGTLDSDNQFKANAFRDGDHWSTWRGRLDIKAGSLDGDFVPIRRADADPTPGTMIFSRLTK